MSETPSYQGRCGCGAVRFVCHGAATDGCYCHCLSCQRASGAPSVAWITFAAERFSLTRGELAEWRSSAQVMRGFCSRCGTSLTYRHDERPDEIDVATVTLAPAAELAPIRHIWLDDAPAWDERTDGLPRYGRWTGSASQ